ncbi:hypothetical protein KAT72_07830 [Aeromonas popoffii]|uniref:DUF3955 domain-containing protein n=1 Tax=Aeromonas popoffii TaxID=70856 RepID=A0ABS5GP81_9GAMM|nr:hypothetical protein [Aeromonas popoffii]MBR7628944.1 hypothetical protein [Aeromonas popoffii]
MSEDINTKTNEKKEITKTSLLNSAVAAVVGFFVLCGIAYGQYINLDLTLEEDIVVFASYAKIGCLVGVGIILLCFAVRCLRIRSGSLKTDVEVIDE